MMHWKTKNSFMIAGVNFKAMDIGFDDSPSTLDEFIFQKPPWMAKRYAALLEKLQPKNIFELGI